MRVLPFKWFLRSNKDNIQPNARKPIGLVKDGEKKEIARKNVRLFVSFDNSTFMHG